MHKVVTDFSIRNCLKEAVAIGWCTRACTPAPKCRVSGTSPIRFSAVALGLPVEETGGMSQRKQKVAPSASPPSGNTKQVRVSRPDRLSRRHWAEEDNAFICRHWEAKTDAEMAVALGRSRVSVLLHRINVLNLRKRAPLPMWGAADDAMFQALYGEVDTFFLAAVLRRPVTALWTRAFWLNLQSRGAWSPEEDEILRDQYPCAPVNEFAHLLPGRSDRNIYHRAGVLGLVRGLPYLLGSWHMRFHAYPPELQSLIRLHNHVERKLQHVKTQH